MDRFRAYSPLERREIEPEYCAATPQDIAKACAQAAQAAHAYAQSSAQQRAAFLDAIAAELQAQRTSILERARAETALGGPRLETEFQRTVHQLGFLAKLVREGSYVDARIESADAARSPVPKPDLRSMLVPLGPVAVFGASNFPLAYSTAGGDSASALAVGCPVIVKGHPLHPGTGALVAQAIERARDSLGLERGVFAYLHAGGQRAVEVGLELVQDPRIQAVGFTGSFEAGRALVQLAQARPTPIPVFAEMGSTNPVFVLPGALAERAQAIAAALCASISNSVGQMCTRPGLIFARVDPALDAFVAELERLAAAIEPQPMLSPAHRTRLEQRLDARARIAGLQQAQHLAAPQETARVVIASTAYEIYAQHPELAEECFGPTVLVVRCASEEQLLEAAQRFTPALTATLQRGARDDRLAQALLVSLCARAGRVIIDGVPTGVEVNQAMQHGGPWPSSSRPESTAVGARALLRWCRPIAYQNWPDAWLPPALQAANPLGIQRWESPH